MTEWDKAYLELKKSKPEPEVIKVNDSIYTFGYIAGCVLAFVFWIWFIIWVAGKV